MGWCLAPPFDAAGDNRDRTTVKRFDPIYWTVDFPRPMMASVVTTAHDALRVEIAFTGRNNLAGLIWDSVDRWDHPLLAYATHRDYRQLTLQFRWRSGGIKPLDAVHGPVLTIEGRDAAGAPRTWYVRLWNYATGTANDAVIALDFSGLDGGFLLPGEADPVWAGDVDRMLISLVPPDYDGTPGDYAAMADGWVELSDIRSDGAQSVLSIGDAMLPHHGLGIATSYDDAYNQTPERLMRQVDALGYGPALIHYVGMSHYPRLTRSGADWQASISGGALCQPALAWHMALAQAARARDIRVIWSLSYELFAAYCPPGWAQRSSDGAMALTGWVPPSTLLSPANAAAMGYLALVARAFVGIAVAAGLPVDFQIGEPWWWITTDRRICLYDAAATAALGGASVPIATMVGPRSAPERTMLDAAGVLLSTSTAAIAAAVRDAAAPGGAQLHLLVYLPTVNDPMMPDARRANMPPGWAFPAFDILQLEDYDWAASGQTGASAIERAAAEARLGYVRSRTHYLAGFVLDAADRAQWRAIDRAAEISRAGGDAATFIWALPQVARDGFVHFSTVGDDPGGTGVQPFHDIDFPLALGREAQVLAEFSTTIISGQSGAEQRAAEWSGARMRYDVGAGIRSEADVRALIDFFWARRGPATAFRFRDPLDFSSALAGGVPQSDDQSLGVGDGVTRDFALRKRYGDGPEAVMRAIALPVPGSVVVSVDGVAMASGWTVEPGGVVRFAAPLPAGASVGAGYLFDVPVRFAEDQLAVSRATFLAGEIASVPLIEVRGALA